MKLHFFLQIYFTVIRDIITQKLKLPIDEMIKEEKYRQG